MNIDIIVLDDTVRQAEESFEFAETLILFLKNKYSKQDHWAHRAEVHKITGYKPEIKES
ncbi:MAG: hypothetical protein MK033_09205 [Candidatus Caenarcaniphilales bacterium]|nr:hypothetical protein [Candidatus Caenarcaniphilales bacterium]